MPVLESPEVDFRPAASHLSFADRATSAGFPVATGRYSPAFTPTDNDGVLEHISPFLIRCFDVIVALAAIILFLPLMALIAIFIMATSAGPGIFCQQRVGRHGIMFPCLKFRTMVIDAQAQLDRLLAESEEARLEWARDQKLRNDPRITAIGEVLRKTSLDELPQLFNILAGHMSIVGPRPIVRNEILRYGARFEHYCSVRPGLTGLWQISGRNDVSYEMRVRLDSLYARRQCLTLNVAICWKTIPAVLASRGCY